MRLMIAAAATCALMIGAGLGWAEANVPAPTAVAATATAPAAKEVTLTGTLECAKCELHETKTCQNVLKVKEGDKEVLYYLDENKVSTDYHSNVCAAPKDNVTVTGVVSKVDGKMTIAATKVK